MINGSIGQWYWVGNLLKSTRPYQMSTNQTAPPVGPTCLGKSLDHATCDPPGILKIDHEYTDANSTIRKTLNPWCIHEPCSYQVANQQVNSCRLWQILLPSVSENQARCFSAMVTHIHLCFVQSMYVGDMYRKHISDRLKQPTPIILGHSPYHCSIVSEKIRQALDLRIFPGNETRTGYIDLTDVTIKVDHRNHLFK